MITPISPVRIICHENNAEELLEFIWLFEIDEEKSNKTHSPAK